MKNILSLLLIFSLIFLNSCIKAGGECEEPLRVESSSLVVNFKDSSGKYLYSQLSPTYNKDSLKVLDEATGNLLIALFTLDNIPNTPSGYWKVNIGPVYNPQTDANSFNSEVCKNFILRYKFNEFDTLKTCFKFRQTKCGSVFETLKVYHKGRLIADKKNDTYAEVTVIKR